MSADQSATASADNAWSATLSLQPRFEEMRAVASVATERLSKLGSAVAIQNDRAKAARNTLVNGAVEVDLRSKPNAQISQLLQTTARAWRAEEHQAADVIGKVLAATVDPIRDGNRVVGVAKIRITALDATIAQLSHRTNDVAESERQFHARLRVCETDAANCHADVESIRSLLATICT